MPLPVEVKSLSEGVIHIIYDDGVSGDIDVQGVLGNIAYDNLRINGLFDSVFIDSLSGDICWKEGYSICKNGTYKKLELINLLKRLKIDLDKI